MTLIKRKLQRGAYMDYSIKTDQGKRKNNQDFTGTFFNQENVLLAILCDGLGGHQAGDIASEMAVSQIGNAWEQTEFSGTDLYLIQKWLQDKISDENTRITEAASRYSDLEGMGTTLVAVVLLDRYVIFANIGDSRAYVFKDETVRLVTEDHSFVSELKRQGGLTEDQAKNHLIKNALTRSLGVQGPIEVDFFREDRNKIDYILLNSDGLSNVVSEDLMRNIFNRENSTEEKANELIEAALTNDASDNITVNIIGIKEKNAKQAGENK